MPQRISCTIFNIVTLGTVFIVLSLFFKLFMPGSDPSASTRVSSNPQDQPRDLTLRFQEDGTFRIAVFEDIHFGEGYLTFGLVHYPVLMLS